MAVVAIDGFDSYNGGGVSPGVQARWNATGNALTLATGRFGGQGLVHAAASTGYGKLFLPSAYASTTFGCAIKATTFQTTAGSVKPIWILWGSSGTVTQVGILINMNGAIEAYRQTSTTAGTLLGTSANNVVILNTWHYMEVETTISDTVGVVNVYIDGVSVLALTGQDTRNGSPTTVDTLSYGQHVGNTGAGVTVMDDLYVTDSATKLGERRVETLVPTADTATAAWTPSTGTSHFAMVDELPANTTDYNSASVVGNTDRYTSAGLSSTPTTIDAVDVVAYALKTDATARSIALQVKSGATTSDGSNYALATSVTQNRRLLTTDPNTAAAWAAAAVNALEFGAKVTV